MRRIPRNYQNAILDAIDKLENFPNVPGANIKALKDHAYGYRMRVGRYRVLFDHNKQTDQKGEIIEIIYIQEVVKRDEQTY